MARRQHSTIALAVAIAALSTAAAAQPAASVYSETEGSGCKAEAGVEGIFVCSGVGGFSFKVSDEGNVVQVFIKHGKRTPDLLFSSHGIGKKLEWRGSGTGTRFAPYAAILRLNFIETDQPAGQVLGIAKIDERGSCVVGYVDTSANPDANALAVDAADRLTKKFSCGNDVPTGIGKLSPLVVGLTKRLS